MFFKGLGKMTDAFVAYGVGSLGDIESVIEHLSGPVETFATQILKYRHLQQYSKGSRVSRLISASAIGENKPSLGV